MNLLNLFFSMATAAEMASGSFFLKQSWQGVSQMQSAVAERVYNVVKWAVNLSLK